MDFEQLAIIIDMMNNFEQLSGNNILHGKNQQQQQQQLILKVYV